MPLQPKGSAENGNWSSFQLANSTPPLSVTGSAIAPSARMHAKACVGNRVLCFKTSVSVTMKSKPQKIGTPSLTMMTSAPKIQRPATCFDLFVVLLGTARVRRFPLPEIVLWTTASQHPSESQTSECSDLLSRSRATFVIAAQRQPGKLH